MENTKLRAVYNLMCDLVDDDMKGYVLSDAVLCYIATGETTALDDDFLNDALLCIIELLKPNKKGD